MAPDFEPRHEGGRDDLYATMRPLEPKEALFALGRRISQSQNRTSRENEIQLTFVDVDVKKAHLNAHCDKENGWSCHNTFNDTEDTSDEDMVVRQEEGSVWTGETLSRESSSQSD